MNTLIPISNICLGVVIGYYLFSWSVSLKQKKYQKTIEDFYLDILKNILLIRFIKRINQMAFFKYKDYEVIYNLNNSTVNVFKGDECIQTSSSISDKLRTDIINEIKRLWGNEILNVIEVNGCLYSVNIVQEEMNRVSSQIFNMLKQQGNSNLSEFNLSDLGFKPDNNIDQYSVDDLLDKINKEGINKLTKEELDFLKKSAE
jgi:hypothetical protein